MSDKASRDIEATNDIEGQKKARAILSVSPNEERREAYRELREAEPDISNRALARAVGVDHETVRTDLASGENSPHPATGINELRPSAGENSPNSAVPAPDPLTAKRAAKEAEREARREKNAELVAATPTTTYRHKPSPRASTRDIRRRNWPLP